MLMKRVLGFACALVLVPSLVAAQPKTPEEWYKEGENQYNLGNFDGAVKAFKEGFALEPNEGKKAAYLFNIAQSYRMAKDCSNAQFFYKRFLALKENDTAKPLRPEVKKDVEDRIRELEACAREQEAIKNRPPNVTITPDGPNPQTDTTKPTPTKPTPTTTATPEGEDGEDGEDGEVDGGGVSATLDGAPRKVSARFMLGGSKISMGDLSVPVQATFGLTGGYPIPLNEKMTVEAGIGVRFTRIAWDAMATTGKTGTASLTAVMANGALTYDVAPKMAVRGDLGLGVLFFGGASSSPFTEGNETDGGALAMFHARLGGAFDYAITPNIVATLPLAFSFSPAKAGMTSGVVAFDFMVGVGYRM